MSLIYSRQRALDLSFPNVAIVGCGGVGTWVAIYSAMGGVPLIKLFDRDTIEIHNLNRLPYSMDALGKKKVHALRDFIVKIRPDIKALAFDARLTRGNASLVQDCPIVFDCTDSSRSHRLLESLWDDGYFQILIRASYDGEHITLAKNFHLEKASWGDDLEGYQIVPSWVIPASFVAQMACFLAYSENAPPSYLLSKSLKDITFLLRNIGNGDRND